MWTVYVEILLPVSITPQSNNIFLSFSISIIPYPTLAKPGSIPIILTVIKLLQTIEILKDFLFHLNQILYKKLG